MQREELGVPAARADVLADSAYNVQAAHDLKGGGLMGLEEDLGPSSPRREHFRLQRACLVKETCFGLAVGCALVVGRSRPWLVVGRRGSSAD